MKFVKATTLAVFGVFVLTSGASAAVVCNEDGDCWRVKDKYEYPADANIQIYDDDWTWGDRTGYRWRDAGKGRGYYRGGVWIDF